MTTLYTFKVMADNFDRDEAYSLPDRAFSDRLSLYFNLFGDYNEHIERCCAEEVEDVVKRDYGHLIDALNARSDKELFDFHWSVAELGLIFVFGTLEYDG